MKYRQKHCMIKMPFLRPKLCNCIVAYPYNRRGLAVLAFCQPTIYHLSIHDYVTTFVSTLKIQELLFCTSHGLTSNVTAEEYSLTKAIQMKSKVSFLLGTL